VAGGQGDGFGAGAGAELGQERTDVELGGVFADAELAGDATIGQALGQQLEDLALARGQGWGRLGWWQWRGGLAGEPVEEGASHGRVKDDQAWRWQMAAATCVAGGAMGRYWRWPQRPAVGASPVRPGRSLAGPAGLGQAGEDHRPVVVGRRIEQQNVGSAGRDLGRSALVAARRRWRVAAGLGGE
jgi:hypothetical protein